MEDQKTIIDLVNVNTYSGLIVVSGDHNQLFRTDSFVVDFHRAWFSVCEHKKVLMTKRLRNYIQINYPEPEWKLKYFDPDSSSFYHKDELKKSFPNRITKKGNISYFSFKGLVLSLTRKNWESINDFLDYILENEEIIKKKDQ